MAKNLLLYLPFQSDFYTGLYNDMKQGFEKVGSRVEGGCEYLSSEELLKKIDDFKPDFVFEMNRTKKEIANFPADVIHICWLVDYWEREPDDIQGSDILYLFTSNWLDLHKNYDGKKIDVLYPAANDSIYDIKPNKKINKDMMFLGHISKPWTEDELRRDVLLSENKSVKFEKIMNIVNEFSINPKYYDENDLSAKKYIMNKLNIDRFDTPENGSLYYDIYCRSARIGRRKHVVSEAIRYYKNLSLYGNENWKFVYKFQPYYKGYLKTTTEMNDAYNQHTYLLHDTSMVHFRTFDSMSAGLITLRPDCSRYGLKDEFLLLGFEEEVDMLTYSLNNFEQTSEKIKSLTIEDIKNARYGIREKIVATHTWSSRAMKILNDVEILKIS